MTDLSKIPVVNLVGPGSQTIESEDQLEYINMPKTMSTFQSPILPEPDELGDLSDAIALLDRITKAMEEYPTNKAIQSFSVDHLNSENLDLLNQIMSIGEVSITLEGPSRIEAQESVFAGLWRIHHLDPQGNIIKDMLEVADIPSSVRQLSFDDAADSVDTDITGITGEIINSPALLVELDAKVREYQSGDPAHTINLSLLPFSNDDLALLGERLGVGPTTILSRGYGNCRIGSTAKNNTWWIKYYNSQDVLILNTIQVIDVPDVAIAALEDIIDSAHRVAEIMNIYQ
jgi:hydrogenase-1 operon protein HyaF